VSEEKIKMCNVNRRLRTDYGCKGIAKALIAIGMMN